MDKKNEENKHSHHIAQDTVQNTSSNWFCSNRVEKINFSVLHKYWRKMFFSKWSHLYISMEL